MQQHCWGSWGIIVAYDCLSFISSKSNVLSRLIVESFVENCRSPATNTANINPSFSKFVKETWILQIIQRSLLMAFFKLLLRLPVVLWWNKVLIFFSIHESVPVWNTCYNQIRKQWKMPVMRENWLLWDGWIKGASWNRQSEGQACCHTASVVDMAGERYTKL